MDARGLIMAGIVRERFSRLKRAGLSIAGQGIIKVFAGVFPSLAIYKLTIECDKTTGNMGDTFSFYGTFMIRKKPMADVEVALYRDEVKVGAAKTTYLGTYTILWKADVAGEIRFHTEAKTFFGRLIESEDITITVKARPPVPGLGVLYIKSEPVAGAPFTVDKAAYTTPKRLDMGVGTWTITFGGVGGYKTPEPQTVELHEGGVVEVVGVYEPVPVSKYTVTVSVKDPYGKAIAEASVYVDGVFQGLTDGYGKIVVYDVAYGDHVFRAEAKGCYPTQHTETITSDTTVKLTLAPK